MCFLPETRPDLIRVVQHFSFLVYIQCNATSFPGSPPLPALGRGGDPGNEVECNVGTVSLGSWTPTTVLSHQIFSIPNSQFYFIGNHLTLVCP